MREASELVAKFFGLPASVVQKPYGAFFMVVSHGRVELTHRWCGERRELFVAAKFGYGGKPTFYLRSLFPLDRLKAIGMYEFQEYQEGKAPFDYPVEFDPMIDKEKRVTATAILIEHLCKGDRPCP